MTEMLTMMAEDDVDVVGDDGACIDGESGGAVPVIRRRRRRCGGRDKGSRRQRTSGYGMVVAVSVNSEPALGWGC
ncbi:hypothetical protein Hanom_Chr04g00363731 [Helianthus anomalus]